MEDIADEMPGSRRRRASGCLMVAAVIGVLLAVAVIGLLLYGVHMGRKVDARMAEIRAAGEPITSSDIWELRDSVPPAENSALVLLDAFAALEVADDRDAWYAAVSLLDGVEPGARCSGATLDVVGAKLAESTEALEIVRKASQFERGVYPLELEENPYLILLPHLHLLREVARLCACQTLYLAHAGAGAEVALSVRDGLRASASLGEGWLLIEALVRFACDAITCDALATALQVCEMPAADLRMLRGELARAEALTDITPAFLGERAFGTYAYAMPARELRMLTGGSSPSTKLLALYSAVPGWRQGDLLFYLDMMGDQVKVCALPEREQIPEARRAGDELEQRLSEDGWRYPLSAMLTPALTRVFEEALKVRMRLRVARTALAVEEYRMANKGWPETLEALVPAYLEAMPQDAFSDGALRYVVTDTGALVYSIATEAGTCRSGC